MLFVLISFQAETAISHQWNFTTNFPSWINSFSDYIGSPSRQMSFIALHGICSLSLSLSPRLHFSSHSPLKRPSVRRLQLPPALLPTKERPRLWFPRLWPSSANQTCFFMWTHYLWLKAARIMYNECVNPTCTCWLSYSDERVLLA